MHYYKKNIGDYHKKAGRLSMLQHGAYSLLMDSIYDREEFPTMDDAIDWLWASSKEEIEAVEFVLRKFFKVENGKYYQNRMAQEIEEYQGLCRSNEINGKKGGRPKGSKNKQKKTQPVNEETHRVNLGSKINPNESDSNPNQEPLTINQEPLTINQAVSTHGHVIDPDHNLDTMADFQNYEQLGFEQVALVPIGTGVSPFERFWEAYGKKTKRADCEKKWKIKKLDSMIDYLLADIKNRDANCHDWRFENGIRKYKSGPLPYLNGELWNNEIQAHPLGGQQMTKEEKEQKSDDEWSDFEKRHRTSDTADTADIEGKCYAVD